MRVPARLSGPAGARRTWFAVCLLAAACSESNSAPEPTGQIRVTSSTTGLSVDPDGYTVVLDEGAEHPIQVNGTLLLDDVAPGNHTLTLAGVAASCHISEQPMTIVVSAGETTEASFAVTCDAGPAFALRLVSTSWSHACGVTAEDTVYCWGSNVYSQLGVDAAGPEQCDAGRGVMLACSSRPAAILSELRFQSVSAGLIFTCGVATDNRAYCWGSNSHGQRGDGTYGNGIASAQLTPVQVAGGLNFRQVSAGIYHTCGVTTDDRAYCWGNNLSGQLGDGTNVDRSTPVAVAGTLRFRQVSADGDHSCGITTDDLAFCWGSSSSGQVGDSSTSGTLRFLPVPVAGNHYFSQIDAGYYHTCAVTTGSRAYCWGSGIFAQLGDGRTVIESTWPIAVAGELFFERITASLWTTCGQTTDNSAYCWGVGASGELGNGTTAGLESCDELGVGPIACSPLPVAVVGGHSFAQVEVGRDFTCARTEANVAYCWGSTGYGLLGNGETDLAGRRPTPTPVLGPL